MENRKRSRNLKNKNKLFKNCYRNLLRVKILTSIIKISRKMKKRKVIKKDIYQKINKKYKIRLLNL